MYPLRRLLKGSTITALWLMLFQLFAPFLAGTPVAHAQSQTSGQLLWWSDGSSFTRFGPNAGVTIDLGKMNYIGYCPKGKADFLYPWTDIYIVPSGSVSVGSKLTDVSGTPNTVEGAGDGSFVSETIGITAPSGKIGPGTYAVVYDECQDGTLDAGDALFDPAFEVVIPTNVPPLPAFTQLKADADSQATHWLIQWAEYKAFFMALQQAEKYLGKVDPGYKLYLSFRKGLFAVAGNPINLTLNHVWNTYKHYKGIAADPPDPNFAQLTTADPREVIDPGTGDPLQAAFTGQVGTQTSNDDALTQALLHAIERYQGAAAASNGEWALIHAREIQRYARLLADQTSRTNSALSSLSAAMSADPGDLDATAADMEAWRARVVASGFNADELREAQNLGLTDKDLAQLQSDLSSENYAMTRAGFLTHLADVQSGNTALAGSLGQLAQDMDAIITTLAGDPSVSQRMPVANAGGPYTGTVGTPVSLNASGSTSPSAITAADWDLDGDGQFGDAQGLTATYTFTRPMAGLAGVRVTNADGKADVAYAPISVAATNGAPSVTAPQPADPVPQVIVGTPATFSAVAVDPDSDPLMLTWSVDNMAVGNASSFTYDPPSTAVGLHRIDLTVKDGNPQHGAVTATWTPVVLMPDQDGDGWRANVDCLDTDPAVHPGATEVVGNGKDDDCNPATTDAGLPPTAFFSPVSSGRNVALLEGGASVVSYSSRWDGSHSVEAMIDYSSYTWYPWATGNRQLTGQYAIIQLAGGNTYVIDRIKLMPRIDYGSQRVKDFQVAVSTTGTDDGSFTVVLKATAQNNGSLQEFVLPRPVPAKYIKYIPLTNQGDTTTISTQQLKVMTGQFGGPTITFRNYATDPDDGIVAYAWDFGDGATSTEPNPTHTFPGPGTYTVTLTVTDKSGNQASYTMAQQVLAAPTADFTWTPASPNEGQGTSFTAAPMDPATGKIIAWTWDWNDGTGSSTGNPISHAFRDNGTYKVRLTVVDDKEQTAQVEKSVTVNNVPPTVNVGGNRTTPAGQPLTFNVSVSDPGSADTRTCTWDYGDGTTTTGTTAAACNFSHTYMQPLPGQPDKTFTATLTVTDKDGGTSTGSLQVTVQASYPGQPAATDMFYTRYCTSPNVRKMAFSYDGAYGFTMQTPASVASTSGADGIIFAPDGDLLIGGQGDRVHKVNPQTGHIQSVTAGGSGSFHLALDKSGTKVWSAGIPGSLAEVPLTPFANGVIRPLTGNDTAITSIAFDRTGTAFYTSSGAGGYGNFGVIDLTTFKTTRLKSGLPAAHGMTFDAYTGHLMLYGSDHITQIDPVTRQIVSDRQVPGASFDQGTTDGKGHLFVASNSGWLFFMDITTSRLVGDARNFVSFQYLDNCLDDVAPLSGLGAAPPASIELVPPTETLPLGAVHTATATVADAKGNLLADVQVTLTVMGANPATFAGVSDANGRVVFTYTGVNAGTDTLVASAGKVTSAAATVVWKPANTAPVLTAAPDQTADEGSAATFQLGSFADPDQGDSWTVSVDWGDGTSQATFAASAAGDLGTQAHTYADNGSYTVTVKVTDSKREADTKHFTVTVNNVAPSAILGQDGPVDEGGVFHLSLTGAGDPSPVDTTAGFTYAFDCGDGQGYGAAGSSAAAACQAPDNATRTVRARVTDKDGGSTEYTQQVIIRNVAPAVSKPTLSTGLAVIGSKVTASASFTDPGVLDTHTASVDWGDGTTTSAAVSESNGSGTVSADHVYTAPGFYVVTMTVTDSDGAWGSALTLQSVIVYDPHGFVTGGGWYDDKASFGFNLKYEDGATVPSGSLEFQVHAQDLNFHASSFDWLVVMGSKSVFEGSGTINGQGNYRFVVSLFDGGTPGKAGVDRFRIKIWDETTGQVMYDNQPGAPDTADAVGGITSGSIVIHK